MKGYRLTEKADAHLQEIWRYSRDRWGKEQADAYLASIDAALTIAIATPSLLRTRPELGDGVVARRARSHVVYGVIVEDTLLVLAVLHGRMDPKRHRIGNAVTAPKRLEPRVLTSFSGPPSPRLG